MAIYKFYLGDGLDRFCLARSEGLQNISKQENPHSKELVGKDNELAKDDIISEETEDTVDVDDAFYKNIFDAGRRETIQGGCGNIQFGRNEREVLLASEDDAFAASAYDNAYVFDKRDLNDDLNKNSSPGEEIHMYEGYRSSKSKGRNGHSQ